MDCICLISRTENFFLDCHITRSVAKVIDTLSPLMYLKLQTDNLMEDHYGKTEKLQNKMMYVMNNSSATVHIADESPLQPSAPKVQKRQINDQQLDDNWQINIVPASQVSAKSIQDTSHTTVQQHSSVAETSQIKVSKRKPVEKNPRKQIFVIADYQRHVMSNIASLWKDRKLCDASISNGSSAVMVHKVVLFAVCPKLLSVFSTNIHSRNFLVINFPEEVSTQALNAFAEYMYNGLLDLDPGILHQLKIIAKHLDMKEFEQLCNSRLPYKISQPSISTSTLLGDHCSTQTELSVPPVQPPLPSSSIISVTSQSTPSITIQAFDIKQEPSETELPTVFRQESEIGPLNSSTNNSSENVCMASSVKIEPVGPEDDEYGHLNKDFDTSTVSNEATTNIIRGITAKLKSNVFESSLVSDLSPVSCIVEKMCSQSSPIREDPSKPLNRTITTQSIDNIVTSGSNEGVYPVGLFKAGGDGLPLSSTQVTNVKSISLYKTNDLT
ncbi:uncharacterized protein LOC106877741 isoform X2 [Octopus bimaculoides]|uniref:uncharacterized protein LOC106877741 isoform X2 n=1 Tax=Octopus bimaculoides TaxID=37653 RepID=UPI00071E4B1F|nr:uncharacterized protein LOC106877741 isoform X2 [Octopus bimaculoides]|eukprot:XP_014782232.1 PREDICTED: uncharacterized protein LOC106877741 isoform X2 [Octopus bimaculoides]